ncbi:unnamed protein product [Trichobilharzia regenti]|nr:unnamed protein product [Trichobilharzia regenti]
MLTCCFYFKLLIISSISLLSTKCLPILLYNKVFIPVDLGGFANVDYPLWGFSSFTILTYYKPYDYKKHVYPHHYYYYYYAPKSKTHNKQKLLVQSSLSSVTQPPSPSSSLTYKNNAPYKKQYVQSSQHHKTSLNYYNSHTKKKEKGKESVENNIITPVNYCNKYHHGYNHQKNRWTPIIYHDQKRKNRLSHHYLGSVKRLNYRHERSEYNYPTQKYINKRYKNVNDKTTYNIAGYKLKNSQYDKYNNGKLKYAEAKFDDSTVGRKDTYDVGRYQSKDLEYDKRNNEGIKYDRVKSGDTLDRKDTNDVGRYQSKDSEYDKLNDEGIKYDREKLINTQDEKRTYGVTRHKPKDLEYTRHTDEDTESHKPKSDNKYEEEYKSKNIKPNKHQSNNYKLSTDYEKIDHDKPLPAYAEPKYAILYDEIKSSRGSHVESRKKYKKLKEKEEVVGLRKMMKKRTYNQKSPNKKSNTNAKKEGKSKPKDKKSDKKNERRKDRDSILMVVNEYT